MRDETIGLLGIGLLGEAIAQRLLAHGYGVIGHDIVPERCRALAAIGGRAALPAEVGRCRRLVLSLPSDAEVEQALDSILPHTSPGGLVINTTTGAPETSVATAARLGEQGLDYLDATVVGSSAELAEGQAVITVGGTGEAVARASDLLAILARRWFHVGRPGAGATMKLVINLVLGLNRAALAEGLALAGRCGLDPGTVLGILRETSAYSRVMDTKGDRMVRGDFTPVARLAQHRKDVRLILELGRAHGQALPLSEAHAGLLDRAIAKGLGELDNSAVIRAYED